MHSPKPFGIFTNDKELSSLDWNFICHEVLKFNNYKSSSNLTSLRWVKDLPDGGYVVIQDYNGVPKTIVYKELSEDYKFDGFATFSVPTLFSGVISSSGVRQGQGVEIELTEHSRRRLSGYSSLTVPKRVELKRFVIEPNSDLTPEFIPKNPSELITTQYVQQRPTWYSGAMAEVMQIVGGYGIQLFDNLPDDPIERARMEIPEDYLKEIINEVGQVRLPAYTGFSPPDGKFQYDYKFHNTHAISFDSQNYPWLVQVSRKGVYAMPLPVIPATTTVAFREWVEEVGDEELLNILDRFKGLPSGEGFPKGSDLEAWERAGVVIKVCDVADFYSHTHYSPACGWSFNLNGNEGFNTCYTYNEDGIALGKSYKMRLDFQPCENRGWLKSVDIDGNDGIYVSKYLSKLFKLLSKHTAKDLAILYKTRRSVERVIERAYSMFDKELDSNEVDWWDNLELEPIAVLNGNVNKIGEGFLYHNADPEFQPQIKFPIVEMGGCISFDFGPLKPVASERRPNCDTIMFGYYIGNSLKVVKYFVDWRSYIRKTEGNFEPVMIVGSWEQTEYIGSSSPQGYFYTTDLDLREVYSPTEVRTTIKGEDKGYDTQPHFSFIHYYAMQGTLWRNRYYTHLTKTDRSSSESISLGVCIPYLCRNVVLVAEKKVHYNQSYTESLSLEWIQDPTIYRYWTYDSVFAWNTPLHKQTGKPYPKNGNPVWVEIEEYHPSEYSDFADQGTWLPNLPYDITWLIHPDVNQWNHSGGGGPPKVKEHVTSTPQTSKTTGGLHVSIHEQGTQVNSNVPHNHYFTASPDDFGNIFYRDACKVSFGNVEYGNISETINGNRRYFWGYSRLVTHSRAYHFIGVINE